MNQLSDEIARVKADLKLARLHAAVLNARECLNATLRDMTEAERINFEHQYGKGAYQIGDFIIREITDFDETPFDDSFQVMPENYRHDRGGREE